jgi:hypothetical protein
MTVGGISSSARMELTTSQRRLDQDTSARDAAQRLVDQDNDAVSNAQRAARRELQSRSVRGSQFDVTV